MNVRNLALASVFLAASSIPMAVSAHEEQDHQIIERTTYRDGWVAEHNYKHRLRLGRLNLTDVETPSVEIDVSRSSPLYLE